MGLHFDETKFAFLSEQLKGRLEVTRQSSEAYLEQLEIDAPKEELRALAQTLTVAETYFFRNSNQFQVLRELALPERLQRQISSAKRLRNCSTPTSMPRRDAMAARAMSEVENSAAGSSAFVMAGASAFVMAFRISSNS